MYSPRNDCFHENICEDGADIVCQECGLVLDCSYSTNSFAIEHREQFCKTEEEDLLLTLRDLWHFSERVIQDCRTLFFKLQKKCAGQFSRRELLAYALYNNLIKYEYGYMPEEVLSKFNIKKSNAILRISQFTCEDRLPNVDDFIDRFATFFDFNFQDKKKMRAYSYVRDMKNRFNWQPKTEAVIIIFLYSTSVKRDLTLKKITEECVISYHNVYRIIKENPILQNEMDNYLSENK